ncbi:MAG: TRAM domain-containing protein [Phycisphaerae bacterium]|nr:TRAM domain-containing protein [Phycisphaerae bacterium]
MLLAILRALFVLIVAGVAMNYVEQEGSALALPVLIVALGAAAMVIGLDVFIPQKSLLAISGLFFGLVVGLLIAFGAGLIIDLLVDAYQPTLAGGPLVSTTKVLIGIVTCYLAVSFILQTKDDVRFVIPYVEFAKQRKGQHPIILDTSVIIDGRIVDIMNAWIVDAPVIVPRFVLHELQAVADSSDKLKRNRGRRGLDILNKLQSNEKLDIQFYDSRMTREEASEPVDQRLVTLARKIDGRVVTNDYNLNKVAKLRGVDVININDLANALKPVFLPGEAMQVKIIKPGEEAGQGVGYLEDGTMVVVEATRDRIGQTVPIMVTSVLQTSAGRMVFGRPEGTPGDGGGRRRAGQSL